MDSLFGQTEAGRTPATMTARVIADANRTFSHLGDEVLLERCAEQAVNELYRDSTRVTTFVPVLALRRVRDLLEKRSTVPLDVAGEV